LLRRLAGAPAIARTMAPLFGLPVFATIGPGVTDRLLR